jgi:NitT/TauT family transport system substrate-binding protein
MAGKTLGIVSAAGATENILDMMLAATEVPKDAVKREVVGNAPAAFQLIKQNRIAAFIATSDTVYQLKIDKQPVVAWSTDDVALCPGQVYMASKARLKESKATIAAFLASVHDCLGDLLKMDDLKPVVASMTAKYDVFEAKRPDGGISVLKQGLENYRPAYESKLASPADKWENAYKLMVKAGLIQAGDDRGFYDDSARALAFS